MDNFDITLEDPRWATVDFETIAQTATQAVLSDQGIPYNAAEISLLACDDARIATLNADFRAKTTPTNVLSWPSEERAAMSPGGAPQRPQPGPDGLVSLGDIAISYDTCATEAQAAGKPLGAHLTHLIVHATLHLLGYDHENDADAALMEGLEVKILGNLGLDDPYREA